MPFSKLRSVFSKSPSPSFQTMETFEDPPLTPITLSGYRQNTKHHLLNEELAEELRQHIPSLLQIGHNWKLDYSLEQNGTSLNTLYNCVAPKVGENKTRRKGYLLIVQDKNKNIFGAYINDYLRPLDGKYYYGNGDCFLWKVEKSKVKKLSRSIENDNASTSSNTKLNALRLKVFPYTAINDFIIYSNNDFISIGSGDGKFGLWVDSNLDTGASDSVDTFGNEPLSDNVKFNIIALEIWRI
ncbi:Oxr1 protein [Martiniozyma asiatica (nom. inval.)]|nr:Oxr1 protein [Martiniozyma asiatica]